MIKINFDSSNILKKEINSYLIKVKKISKKIENFKIEGFHFLGWKDLPEHYNNIESKQIKKEVKRLKKENINVLVVIGTGESILGSKAAIEMINGKLTEDKENLEIVYVNASFSSTDLAQKLLYVEYKNFAINVISKAGNTLETTIAFRLFKKLLEDKVGFNNASKFIILTTDGIKDPLLALANKKKYTKFITPNNIGLRFSVLTFSGLFPMAFLNLNIDKIMKGALLAHKKYSLENMQENEAYKYAVYRLILMKKYQIELLTLFEPQMKAFGEWWKHLFAESGGKNEKGLFPVTTIFTRDIHKMGQFIQEGPKILFEIFLKVQKPNINISIIPDYENIDNLNYINDVTLHEINNMTSEIIHKLHYKIAKIPIIQIEIQKMDEINFGELIIFFERVIMMSSYLMEINPLNQPGLDFYKETIFSELQKKFKNK